MRSFGKWCSGMGGLGLLLASSVVVAQDNTTGAAQSEEVQPQSTTDEGLRRTRVGAGQPSEALPPPQSDDDPRPPPPAPSVVTTAGITEQAGVGGTQAYGRAGVLELGGSVGFSAASDYTRFELSPSIGVFLIDNLQLSLLTSFNYFRVGESNGNPETSATELKALIEPSFHVPFSPVVFGFVGLGAGVTYITDNDAGFAIQPRLGANIMIGRSGILTPAFNIAYSTVDAIRTEVGTVLAVRTSYGLNIGYTVMW
jgi:hypothetical protein